VALKEEDYYIVEFFQGKGMMFNATFNNMSISWTILPEPTSVLQSDESLRTYSSGLSAE
jgi:hypothetical protein